MIYQLLQTITNLRKFQSKTDEEFKEYCQFAERVGLPKPDRNSKVRPLHEK